MDIRDAEPADRPRIYPFYSALVETNTAAVALWKALGFDVIGTVPEAFDHRVHCLVGLHVMYRRL